MTSSARPTITSWSTRFVNGTGLYTVPIQFAFSKTKTKQCKQIGISKIVPLENVNDFTVPSLDSLYGKKPRTKGTWRAVLIHVLHLFPASLGDSACISEISQAMSAVRQFGGRSGMIRQPQYRNSLHFYRITCILSKISRKKVYYLSLNRLISSYRLLSLSHTVVSSVRVQKHLTRPSEPAVSDPAWSLVSGLLTDNNRRLAHAEVLQHSFFTSIDWNNIANSGYRYTGTFGRMQAVGSGPGTGRGGGG